MDITGLSLQASARKQQQHWSPLTVGHGADGSLDLGTNAVVGLLHGLAQQLRQAGHDGRQAELVLRAILGATL